MIGIYVVYVRMYICKFSIQDNYKYSSFFYR